MFSQLWGLCTRLARVWLFNPTVHFLHEYSFIESVTLQLRFWLEVKQSESLHRHREDKATCRDKTLSNAHNVWSTWANTLYWVQCFAYFMSRQRKKNIPWSFLFFFHKKVKETLIFQHEPRCCFSSRWSMERKKNTNVVNSPTAANRTLSKVKEKLFGLKLDANTHYWVEDQAQL